MIEYFRDLRLIPIAVVASTCLLALVAADLLLGRLASLSDGDSSRFKEVTVIHAAPGAARSTDSKRSWAQQMFNFPDPKARPRERDDLSFLPVIPPLPVDKDSAEVTTGSVPEPSSEKSEKAKGEAGAANKEAADKPAGDKQSGEKQTAGKEGSAKEPKDQPPSPNGKVIPVNATPNPSPSAAERAILERLQERRQELENARANSTSAKASLPMRRRGSSRSSCRSRRASSSSRPRRRRRKRPKRPASRAW
jgi:hypothetical protein